MKTEQGAIGRTTERFIYFFCFIYFLLPNYFALEFSGSLPLLSVSRVLFLVLYILFAVYVIKKKEFSVPRNKGVWICMGIYFSMRLLANLYYFRTYSDAINNIFKMLAEQIALIIIFPEFLSNDEKRLKAVKMLVYGCGVISILGILETLTGVCLFDYLYTVKRSFLSERYIRMGLLRAATSFGHANLMAFYMSVMAPFVFWLYGRTKEKRFFIIAILHFFALVFTGSRGSLFAYGITVLLYFFLSEKEERGKLFRRFAIGAVIAAVLIFGQRAVSVNLKYYYDTTVKSLLNAVGFDFDLNEGAPEGSGGYGTNAKEGNASRLSQFSGIEYTVSVNPLFGLGAGADRRGDIYYKWNGKWRKSHTYDVGYVGIISDEGLIGALGFAFLLAGIITVYVSELAKTDDAKKKRFIKTIILINIVFHICMLFVIQNMTLYFMINAIGLSSLGMKRITLLRKRYCQ